MLKQIGQYISYIMGVLGFAGVIWTYATKSAEKDFDVSKLSHELQDIKKEIVTKDNFKEFVDSMDVYNVRIEDKMNTVISSQNSLRSSYVKYIKSAVTDREFFIELLNGIQWEVNPINDKRTDSIDFKIKIRKKQ